MWSRRNSPVSALLLAVCAALGCARSHDRPRVDEPADGERDSDPDGVFADIAVRVDSYDGFHDPISTAAPTPGTLGAMVFINSGESGGRVPGLRVFLGDAELKEVGNAAFPQHFSYQGPDQPLGAGPLVLRLRLGEASFSHRLEPRDVDLTEPEKGAELASDGEFVVRWTGAETPEALGISRVEGSTCELMFGVPMLGEGEAIYPVSPLTSLPPPGPLGPGNRQCRADLALQWKPVSEPLTGTPFASFEVTRNAKRTRRFLISCCSLPGRGAQ